MSYKEQRHESRLHFKLKMLIHGEQRSKESHYMAQEINENKKQTGRIKTFPVGIYSWGYLKLSMGEILKVRSRLI